MRQNTPLDAFSDIDIDAENTPTILKRLLECSIDNDGYVVNENGVRVDSYHGYPMAIENIGYISLTSSPP